MSSYATPNPAGGGLNLKRLPPWAWAVAIAGGAVVGFFLLKSGQGEPEAQEETDGGVEGLAKPAGGTGAVVQPLTDDQLSALGLTPGFQTQGYTDGFGGTFNGDGGGGVESGGETQQQLFAPSTDTALGQSYAVAQQQVTQQITSVAPAVGAALASYFAPAPAPAPSGGGGGSAKVM